MVVPSNIPSPYGILIDLTINSPDHGNNFVDVINATNKLYLKGKWNFLIN